LRYFQLLERRAQARQWQLNINFPRIQGRDGTPWRSLIAAMVAIAVGWAGGLCRQQQRAGREEEEGGFDGDARPQSIEANSGSVLFERMRTSCERRPA